MQYIIVKSYKIKLGLWVYSNFFLVSVLFTHVLKRNRCDSRNHQMMELAVVLNYLRFCFIQTSQNNHKIIMNAAYFLSFIDWVMVRLIRKKKYIINNQCRLLGKYNRLFYRHDYFWWLPLLVKRPYIYHLPIQFPFQTMMKKCFCWRIEPEHQYTIHAVIKACWFPFWIIAQYSWLKGLEDVSYQLPIQFPVADSVAYSECELFARTNFEYE